MNQAASARPIARLVLLAAVLLLGAVAATRVEIAYLPAWSLPELRVDLRLPEGTALGDLTRRWVVPLESSIRAVGDVRGMAGEVNATGGGFRVRFRAGTDAERKAARLESELAGLRRALPPGAGLSIWPVGQGAGDESAIIWLGAEAGAHRVDRSLIEALRDLPEVRSVVVAGEAGREVRVGAHRRGPASAAALAAAIDRGHAFQRLGEARFGGRMLPVVVADQRHLPFADLPLIQGTSLVPLRAVADVELRQEEAPWIAHLEGVRGLVLLISREIEASPLALERSLRRTFEVFGLGDVRSLLDEAAPLRLLLTRLFLGLFAAVALMAAASWWLLGWRAALWQTAALPVAAAAAVNAFWLAGVGLDVTTLPTLAAGLGGALFFGAFRVGQGAGSTVGKATVIVSSALVLPVAVALAGGRLAPLLAAPVRAFVLAVVAGVAALWILPRPQPGRLPPRRLTVPLRRALRNPWTVLLGATVSAYLLFVLSGRALVPRPGNLAPALGDLAVELRFVEGATPDQASAQIAAVEQHLDEMEEVEGHWSVFTRRRGTVVATVRRQDRRLARLRSMAIRIQAQLSAIGASARVVPLAAGGDGDSGARFTESLEDEPETDDEVTFYRFILRHTDVEALQLAHARVMDRLFGFKGNIWYDQIHADWGKPATRLELVPRPGVSTKDADAAAAAVALGASLPGSRPLAADRDLRLRVMDPRAPRKIGEVRQRADLLGLQASETGRLLVPSALFETREVLSSPTVRRQSGRFVLPITVRLAGSLEHYRRADRQSIDHALSILRLPAGTALERPELNPAIWTRERRRMAAIAGALPALLLALAVCRLNSLGAGLAALVPPVLGVAAAAPWIHVTKGHVDELTLLLLGAALVGSFPVTLEAAAASSRPATTPLAGGAAYRWLARRAVGLAIVVPALSALLVVPGLGLDNDRHPWVLPLRAAGVAATVACLTSLLVLPVLLRTARRLRSRDKEQQRQLASPPAWREAVEGGTVTSPETASLELETRNLSKVYRDGFQALHTVSFRLEPGIVGLLGPNGAGKTTLLRLLCGLLESTRGQVKFRGVPLSPTNLAEYRRLVGYLPQGFNAYEGFTGAEFLDYWAIERGYQDRRERDLEVERVLEQVGLADAAGRKVRDFSGGMRRRIGIARTLLGEPPIVIVDEPTTGLDVESRNRLRETLLAVAGERIIIFSTHIASDVAAAASRILLLDRGRLVFDGPALDLLDQARGQVFEALIEDHDLKHFSHRYRVTTRVRTLDGLKVRAIAYGDEEPAGEIVEPNLEEAYLAMIGSPDRQRDHQRGSTGSLLDLEVWDSRKTTG